MSLIQNKQIFYIDSSKGQGKNENFTYTFQFDQTLEFDRCCILQLLIPMSYWLIQEDQNTFILNEGINKEVTIYLPLGNYNRRSLASVLSNILTSNSPSSFTYLVTFPNIATTNDQGLYTYNVSNNGSVQPQFIFQNNATTEALGFQSNSTNNFVSNTLISTSVIKLKPEDQLFLHSDLCSNKNDDIIQEVYSAGNATFSNILFQQFDVESNSKDISFNKNNSYKFYLTDENNTILNLNGQNMTITLMLYKKNTIFTMLIDFIKYLTLKL